MSERNLSEVVLSILFAAGKEVETKLICDKLSVSADELAGAVSVLKERLRGDAGLQLLEFNGKIQLATNPRYVDEVMAVLNPVREKELTRSLMETLSIIAYKQPVTRLEIEDIKGVDSTYALQTLLKMSLIEVMGRKDVIGKPMLFGTTDEFLKRFELKSLAELPDSEGLIERIQIIEDDLRRKADFYNSNRDLDFSAGTEEPLPEFLEGEKIERIG